jgi:hypothetical protein
MVGIFCFKRPTTRPFHQPDLNLIEIFPFERTFFVFIVAGIHFPDDLNNRNAASSYLGYYCIDYPAIFFYYK